MLLAPELRLLSSCQVLSSARSGREALHASAMSVWIWVDAECACAAGVLLCLSSSLCCAGVLRFELLVGVQKRCSAASNAGAAVNVWGQLRLPTRQPRLRQAMGVFTLWLRAAPISHKDVQLAHVVSCLLQASQ
jgi:hypothetical protein